MNRNKSNDNIAPLELKYYVDPSPTLNSMTVERNPYIIMNQQAIEHEKLKRKYLETHPEAVFDRRVDAIIDKERARHIETVTQDRARKSVWEYARDRSNSVLAKNPYIVKKPLLITIVLLMAVALLTLFVPAFFSGESDVGQIFSPFEVAYMKEYTAPEASADSPITKFEYDGTEFAIGGKTANENGGISYAVIFVDKSGEVLKVVDSLFGNYPTSEVYAQTYGAKYAFRNLGRSFDEQYIADVSDGKIYTQETYYPSFIDILKSWITRPSEKEGYNAANKQSFLYRMAVLDNKDVAAEIASEKAEKRILSAFVSKTAIRGVGVFFLLFVATAVAVTVKAAIGLSSAKRKGWTLTFFWTLIVTGLFSADILAFPRIVNCGAAVPVGQWAVWSVGSPVCAIVCGAVMLGAALLMPFIYRLLKLKEALPYVFDTLIDSKIVSD